MNWAMRVGAVGTVVIGVATLSVSVRPEDKSAVVYKQKCVSCHGADGKGETAAGKAMKVRSFSSPETAKMSDQELADTIEKGRGKMPKYGASMNSEDIKAMVAYVRTLAK